MRYFLWKLAGADIQILNKSGKKSQFLFSVIGVLLFLIFFLIYFGVFGLFTVVFKSSLIFTLFGTLVIGFLISTIYRINMISLEPNPLPIKDDKTSKFLSNSIRYLTIGLFAFFIGKFIEIYCMYLFSTIRLEDMKITLIFNTSKHLLSLKLISLIVFILFIIPIVLANRLKTGNEFYRNRFKIYSKIVLNHYNETKNIKEKSYAILYNEYKQYNEIKKFKSHISKYEDEPFNTKLKSLNKKCQDSLTFVHLSNWK